MSFVLALALWLVGCIVQLGLPVFIKGRKDRKVAIVFGIIWCLHLPFVIHDGLRLFS